MKNLNSPHYMTIAYINPHVCCGHYIHTLGKYGYHIYIKPVKQSTLYCIYRTVLLYTVAILPNYILTLAN